MRRFDWPGAALPRLCLAVFVVSALSSCHSDERQAKARRDLQEVHGDIQAAKNNPSFGSGSNQAGPPLHLDPYPHSRGMTHHAGGPGKPRH